MHQPKKEADCARHCGNGQRLEEFDDNHYYNSTRRGEFFQVAWFGKVLDLCLLGYKGDSHFSEKSNIDHYRSSPRMCAKEYIVPLISRYYIVVHILVPT